MSTFLSLHKLNTDFRLAAEKERRVLACLCKALPGYAQPWIFWQGDGIHAGPPRLEIGEGLANLSREHGPF